MTKYRLKKLTHRDGSWDKLKADWVKQCAEVGDDFKDYAPATMPIIKTLSRKPERGHWACSLYDGTRYLAVCVAHHYRMPGLDGHILKMRLMVPCPLLDYGALSDESYADAIIGFAYGAIKLSDTTLKANHIKYHLRSPADTVYFRAFGTALDNQGVFASTELKGAWLYITKQSQKS